MSYLSGTDPLFDKYLPELQNYLRTFHSLYFVFPGGPRIKSPRKISSCWDIPKFTCWEYYKKIKNWIPQPFIPKPVFFFKKTFASSNLAFPIPLERREKLSDRYCEHTHFCHHYEDIRLSHNHYEYQRNNSDRPQLSRLLPFIAKNQFHPSRDNYDRKCKQNWEPSINQKNLNQPQVFFLFFIYQNSIQQSIY